MASSENQYPSNPTANLSSMTEATDDIILKKILASTLPIEVHETESVQVIIDGQPIKGIWVNKEDSMYWRPDNPKDKRNALNLSSSELEFFSKDAEIIKKNYALTNDLVQNVGIKFLKPAPPCVGDLIIG